MPQNENTFCFGNQKALLTGGSNDSNVRLQDQIGPLGSVNYPMALTHIGGIAPMQATRTLPYSRKAEIQQEALTRAISGQSLSNYPAIFQGFLAKGIPESEIKPRENVFSFQAWKAQGRHVRRGEHGVKVATVRDFRKTVKDPQTGQEKEEVYSVPWSATVFHVSQTEPNELRGIVNPVVRTT